MLPDIFLVAYDHVGAQSRPHIAVPFISPVTSAVLCMSLQISSNRDSHVTVKINGIANRVSSRRSKEKVIQLLQLSESLTLSLARLGENN